MSVKLLIEGIVQQTTVLIAQLSTAAGVRAPLSHIADQVFLSLAREIHAQGVPRKVAADMFGMALRAYQLKVQRLSESASVRDRTLWEAVLEHLSRSTALSRSEIVARFSRDGEKETLSVLNDLVNSGLVYCTGRGPASVYGITSESERKHFSEAADQQALIEMLWGVIYREPGLNNEELCQLLPSRLNALQAALAQLESDGRVRAEGESGAQRWYAKHFLVKVGAESGWESAVLDHFQALTRAICIKLTNGALTSKHRDVVGGATLRFQLSPGHPFAAQVLGTLQRERRTLNELWQQVSDYNDANPISPEQRVDVCFYLGQSVSGDAWAPLSDTLDGEQQ